MVVTIGWELLYENSQWKVVSPNMKVRTIDIKTIGPK
jgi:hypothetical protein